MEQELKKEGDTNITADDMNTQFGKNNTNAEASGNINVYFPESERWYKIDGKGNVTGPSDTEPEKGLDELYDGINNPEDENYNENSMHIGDYVDYSAGTWEETKENIGEYEFGGYIAGQSRDTNSQANYENDGTQYEGWRIFDISDDKKTVTLISAGCPEVYYNPNKQNAAYKSWYILTGKTSENDTSNITEGVTQRNWNMYVNQEKHAIEAKALEKEELDDWYNKYIDNSITDTWGANLSENSGNKLISILTNNMRYFLATPYLASDYYGSQAYTLWSYDADEEYPSIEDGYHNGYGRAIGIRILVKLDANTAFEETTEKIEKDGFSYNVWKIKNAN